MWLCVGLGNPGNSYTYTRHNLGSLAVDSFAEAYDFDKYSQKFNGLISVKQGAYHKVILFKPQTFMNLSGKAISLILNFYKIPLSQLIVFHDDIDLQPNIIKIKLGGGAGGHNGLKSIDAEVGKEYWRVRLGIGHPGAKHLVSNFVLNNFLKAEFEDVVEMLEKLTTNFGSVFATSTQIDLKDFIK